MTESKDADNTEDHQEDKSEGETSEETKQVTQDEPDSPQGSQESATPLVSLPPAPQVAPSTPKANNSRKRRRKQVVIAEESEEKGLALPQHHYETTLHRRSTRKSSTEDVSLGMKLSIVAGKVIVQKLIPLADGRASPAQLVGVIRRGDVVLAVNGKPLWQLPIQDLMGALAPLSSPNDEGVYAEQLHLKLAIGEGLSLLKGERISNAKEDSPPQPARPESDIFSLLPMVDQLSGTHLFEDLPMVETPTKKPVEESKEPEVEPPVKELPLNDMISLEVARRMTEDRSLFLSEFFVWRDDSPELMRWTHDDHPMGMEKHLSAHELAELGKRALAGAKLLSISVEKVDRGSDLRSFHSWNTTLSLYSRASTRRRQVFDVTTMPINIGKVDEEDEEDTEMQSSANSDDGDMMDGDELLVHLSAHDDIWRKQVIEYLEKADRDHEMEEPSETEETEDEGIDAALSKELGSFLFGDKMANIIAKKKKSKALPPDEITMVLFDLTTKISSTVPDEITASGSHVSLRSKLAPYTGMKTPAAGSDVMLSTRFLLDEALPAWIRTFRPLPWEQRRVLWPPERSGSGESTVTSTISDELSIDSLNTGTFSSSVAGNHTQRKKNLQERVEEKELNVESRSETCFLVTFYFTQKLLPRMLHVDGDDEKQRVIEELASFVNEYGAYLKLHTCLAYAAVVHAENVIDMLLNVARHDPKHKEYTKALTKGQALIFYEPTMLSAVLQRLRQVRDESSDRRRETVIDLCSSAYPDVRPWQVRKALTVEEDPSATKQQQAVFDNMFYSYLSLLLHPLDGHDSARRDESLVREWCELSVRGSEHVRDTAILLERRSNFSGVASRASSDHLAYNRDLDLLLDLSVEMNDNDLILDLCTEILDEEPVAERVDKCMSIVREVAEHTLPLEDDDEKQKGVLARSIHLFERAASLRSGSVHVADELVSLVEARRGKTASCVLALLHFFGEEASRSDSLEALGRIDAIDELGVQSLCVVRDVLVRTASASRNEELSWSLLRVQRSRLLVGKSTQQGDMLRETSSTWKRMSRGMLSISK